MTRRLAVMSVLLFLLAGPSGFARRAGEAAQTPPNGAIDFAATAKSGAARPEPIRGLPFFLLRKSLADIQKEAEQAEHATGLEEFVDSLQLSPELKTWMKKHHLVDMVGADFTKQLTPDDVVSVPEFFEAYTVQNGASLGGGIPIPKESEKEKKKNPEKYEREREIYTQLLRRYIAANPDTVATLDVDLRDKNPGPRWAQLEAQHQQHVSRRSLELAMSEYLVAKTESDLNGNGSFAGIAPGTYWITTLDTPALAGDQRLRWDVSVNVRAGETAGVELSNLNALESANRAAP